MLASLSAVFVERVVSFGYEFVHIIIKSDYCAAVNK